MSAQGYPVSLQKTLISDEINSTVLGVFLWGIYSVVYISALYIHLTKRPSASRLIVGAMTLSYLAYSVIAVLFWYYDQFAVVNDSGTQDTLFSVLFELGPTWPSFVGNLMTFIMAGAADGILIWRCFHVWGRSLRWILVPLILFLSEIAIGLLVLALQAAQHLNPSYSQTLLDDRIFAAQTFITFATTATSTALTAYRIYITSKEGIFRNSKRLYNRIIEILLQSAALYSVAAIAQAISSVIPETLANVASVNAADAYTPVLFDFIAGVAPTILVARVAMLGDQDAYSLNSLRIPGSLQFDVRSTVQDRSQPSENNSQAGTSSQGIHANVDVGRETSNI